MPDVKPRPRAGAIRLSLIRADQKGTRSASEFVIVACIPGVLALTAGPRRKPILTPITAFDRNAQTAKKLNYGRS
jgi:hypothetical protein